VTLVQFGKAYADEFYEGTVPRDAERPYFVHVRGKENSRLVWVKSTILRPTFHVHPQGFALLSDAGPMALTPAAPGLAPREEPSPGVFLRLKADGTGLAPHIGTLMQMELEERRDDLGAAEFLKRYPDERVVVAFAKKLSCLLGHVEIEIAGKPGIGEGHPGHIACGVQGRAERAAGRVRSAGGAPGAGRRERLEPLLLSVNDLSVRPGENLGFSLEHRPLPDRPEAGGGL
jgi:hypothetical protein